MNNKRWTAVVGIVLLAGIVASAVFFQQRNEIRKYLQESRDQIDRLERRNAELNESLENQKSRLDERQVELTAVRRRLQEDKSASEKLQAALTAAEQTVAERMSERSQLEAERDALGARISSIERDAAKSEATIAALSQTIAEGNARVSALQEEANALRNTMAVKDQQLRQSQDAQRAGQAENEGLRKDLAAAKVSADALDTRLKAVSDERDGLILKMSALTAESDDLRKEMAALETRHREELADQNHKITELSSALALKSEQLQEFMDQMPELKDRLKQTLAEAKAHESKLEVQQKTMKETYEALMSGLKQQLDSKEASIEAYRQQLKVTFVDRILFGFSQVRISPQGKSALDQLASALSSVPEGRISIVGHADNVPVASNFRSRFPSNWELSSARAGAVARYLLNRSDIDPGRIETIGLSSYHPIADNDTNAGRAKNRRVEIIITPGLEENH